jgi:hypothetical protein
LTIALKELEPLVPLFKPAIQPTVEVIKVVFCVVHFSSLLSSLLLSSSSSSSLSL